MVLSLGWFFTYITLAGTIPHAAWTVRMLCTDFQTAEHLAYLGSACATTNSESFITQPEKLALHRAHHHPPYISLSHPNSNPIIDRVPRRSFLPCVVECSIHLLLRCTMFSLKVVFLSMRMVSRPSMGYIYIYPRSTGQLGSRTVASFDSSHTSPYPFERTTYDLRSASLHLT